ncbi:hypothetical protein INR49_029462 [Caranx melampygus]|nr:hypothetical protein INR49_029462 [Caranx melampygus]
MADKTPKESDAPFARRIDPTKEGLSPEQLHYIRQVEREQWKKKSKMLRGRNAITGFAIGALVLGILCQGNMSKRCRLFLRDGGKPLPLDRRRWRLDSIAAGETMPGGGTFPIFS